VPTQPPVQWVPGVLSLGVKRGRGVMLTTHPHLVPRLRMSRSYISSPPQAPSWLVAGQLYFPTVLIFADKEISCWYAVSGLPLPAHCYSSWQSLQMKAEGTKAELECHIAIRIVNPVGCLLNISWSDSMSFRSFYWNEFPSVVQRRKGTRRGGGHYYVCHVGKRTMSTPDTWLISLLFNDILLTALLSSIEW
jgi:hypothetical protein